MKTIKFKRVAVLSAWVAGVILTLVACDGGLNVKQAYGFDLETMPVQDEILQGETAEIRCAIIREGEYSGTRFFLRYFQPDGDGELRLDDGTLFAPNDLYPLDRTEFRLYYTSRSDDQQTVDVYIEDSFGQAVQKSFSWQNENADDDATEEYNPSR
jgi:hypothetical protein